LELFARQIGSPPVAIATGEGPDDGQQGEFMRAVV
jgi:hypothetical protein